MLLSNLERERDQTVKFPKAQIETDIERERQRIKSQDALTLGILWVEVS